MPYFLCITFTFIGLVHVVAVYNLLRAVDINLGKCFFLRY